MYSVLLVEDERLELETLRDYVNWKQAGVEQVYTARGGRSALGCIAEHEPDILITDIQMPGMSGLELAEIVRREGYSCKIVFLTGYDEFEYAKSAIRLHAEDYILKPFIAEEIEQLVRRLIAGIQKEQRTEESVRLARGKLLEQICLEEDAGVRARLAEEAGLYLSDLSGSFDSRDTNYAAGHRQAAGYGIFAVYGANPETVDRLRRSPELLQVFGIKNRMAIAVTDACIPVANLCAKLKGELENRDAVFVYIAHPVAPVALYDRYQELQKLSDLLFFAERGKILSFDEQDGGACDGACCSTLVRRVEQAILMPEGPQAVTAAIFQGNREEASRLIDDYSRFLRTLPAEECRKRLYELYTLINYEIKKGDALYYRELEEKKATLGSWIFELAFFSEILERLKEDVDAACSHYLAKTENQDWYITSWVKDYIKNNYAGDCSVEEMAECLGLSPNYLRSRFKTGEGKTILEYLTEYRLELSCELLKAKNRKVKEISMAVGYDNVPYFTQIFRKRYGMTPNEYKKIY